MLRGFWVLSSSLMGEYTDKLIAKTHAHSNQVGPHRPYRNGPVHR